METRDLYGDVWISMILYGSLSICMDCYVSKDSWVLNIVS